jgi:hypothetical protein
MGKDIRSRRTPNSSLKVIFLHGHRDFTVQYHFLRTRDPLYLILQTNYPLRSPLVILLFIPFPPHSQILSLLPSVRMAASPHPVPTRCPVPATTLPLPPRRQRTSSVCLSSERKGGPPALSIQLDSMESMVGSTRRRCAAEATVGCRGAARVVDRRRAPLPLLSPRSWSSGHLSFAPSPTVGVLYRRTVNLYRSCVELGCLAQETTGFILVRVGMAIRGQVPVTRRVPAPMGPDMGLIFHLWVRGG